MPRMTLTVSLLLGLTGRAVAADPPVGPDKVLATYYSPTENLPKAAITLINSSSSAINFAANTFTDPNVAAALSLASSRGVAVSGVFDITHGTANVGQWRTLLTSGGSVWFATFPASLQNHVLTVDSGTCATGTYYFSPTAVQAGSWLSIVSGTAAVNGFNATFGTLQASGTRQTSWRNNNQAEREASMSAPLEVRYAIDLAKKMTSELGFIPKDVYSQALDEKRLFFQHENDDPCGFLLAGNLHRGHIKIYQCAIQIDARRRANAAQMVARMKEHAQQKGANTLTLRCADDLDSNLFWKAQGFVLVNCIDTLNARKRKINRYVLDLSNPRERLFDIEQEPQIILTGMQLPPAATTNFGKRKPHPESIVQLTFSET
jgi:hypothetical protein